MTNMAITIIYIFLFITSKELVYIYFCKIRLKEDNNMTRYNIYSICAIVLIAMDVLVLFFVSRKGKIWSRAVSMSIAILVLIIEGVHLIDQVETKQNCAMTVVILIVYCYSTCKRISNLQRYINLYVDSLFPIQAKKEG